MTYTMKKMYNYPYMKRQLGVFFGGRSAEHEVSVISAVQACAYINTHTYNIIPIYVSKTGDFYTNPLFLDIKNYKDVKNLLMSSKQITMGRKNGKPGFFTYNLFSSFTPLDVACPMFHGSFGEDGWLQGVF